MLTLFRSPSIVPLFLSLSVHAFLFYPFLSLFLSPPPPLSSGGADGVICIWDVNEWKPIKRIRAAHKGGVHSLEVVDDVR